MATKGKVYFAHLRTRVENEEDRSYHFGGRTFAWVINEDGSITVSVPAKCATTDRYNRKVGASLASQNLADGKVLLTIDHSTIGYLVSKEIPIVQLTGFANKEFWEKKLTEMFEKSNPMDLINDNTLERIVRFQLSQFDRSLVEKFTLL